MKERRGFMTSTEQASVPAMAAFVIGGTGMLLSLLPCDSVFPLSTKRYSTTDETEESWSLLPN